MARILIIDDDTSLAGRFRDYLEKNGYQTDVATSASSGQKHLIRETYDLIISDYHLPDTNGLKLLESIKEGNPHIPVIIITAHKNLPVAVKMIKAGAYDYLTKPIHPEILLDLVKEAIEHRTTDEDNLSFEDNFITGTSDKFNKVLEQVKIVAPVNMSVILEGETGSGKEYIARAIHRNSLRKDRPFVAIDCGALTKNLANSELFGHVKGSFTGASYDKPGVFEQATKGTLFLDEISNLDAENQVKLLRVLQEKVITRLGSTSGIPVDVRLVVASNQDLREEVGAGKLREDLFHRLNEFKIRIPPLRERKADIRVFTNAFLDRASERFKKQVSQLDKEAWRCIENYPWPGNIRELKNTITRAVLLCQDQIVTSDLLPGEIRRPDDLLTGNNPGSNVSSDDIDLQEAVDEAERNAVLEALEKTGYNKTKAAELLDIDRSTLYNKIRQFQIPLRKK